MKKIAFKTKIVLALIGVVAFILILGGIVFGYKLSSLDSIELSPLSDTTITEREYSLPISGIVSGAQIEVYADEKLIASLVSQGPTMIYVVKLETDGVHKLKVRQRLGLMKWVKYGEFSDEITINIDTTPPDGTISVVSSIPELTNQQSLPLTVSVEGDDIFNFYINSQKYDPNESEIEYILGSGKNFLQLKVVDEFGNSKSLSDSYTVTYDNKAPNLQANGFFCTPVSSFASSIEESICIKVGQFYGPLTGTAYAPVTGQVQGNIEKITFDGKILTVNKDLNINQLVPIYVRRGSNTYDVRVIDKAGNETVQQYKLEWDTEEANQQADLQSQIDDLQSQLDDIDANQ